MKFTTLENVIKENLPSTWDDKGVYYYPGPNDPDQPVDLCAVLTIDGGLGLQLDGVLDNVSWQVRVLGAQNLYQLTEDLANDIDKTLLSLGTHTTTDGLRVVSIYRVGGPPAHLDYDDAERTQFVCSYFFDVESGLPPI